ncbi:hypothetical protein DFR86_08780 [Acidianus sulfidivorans JP7]|uniref:Heavy-metal chelation domain-containing protein n=1 Tax=Acidianus sulfidivorans JP7 TaxID=619593 RepID=A0A2U9INQ4_9CREN|nr:DUF364 domain-containing protein [Acidianus sulfidivorans]AWR97631.1 hypothetical protein DFR86_08780 [Acidianus sulfidivorans JP7]
MILDEILDELSFDLKKRKVINLCVGISYTGVILDDQSMGISHTMINGEIKNAGEIIGRNAYEIASNIDDELNRSISVSILNAITTGKLIEGDLISQYSGNKVCVFGYSPYVAGNFKEKEVYDFSSVPVQGAKPFSKFTSENCDVGIIFGSAFIADNAIDKIVRNIRADHLILTGISSIEAPITLKKYGFEAIEKIIPFDKYRAFRTICEGGSSKELIKYVKKAYLKI